MSEDQTIFGEDGTPSLLQRDPVEEAFQKVINDFKEVYFRAVAQRTGSPHRENDGTVALALVEIMASSVVLALQAAKAQAQVEGAFD